MWVAFQTSERVNSNQTLNKRIFDNLGITEIQVRNNGRQYPESAYKFRYDATNGWRDYQRAYHAFLSSGYKVHDDNEGSLLTLEMFEKLYSIFYFDMTCQDPELYTSARLSEIEIRYTPSINVDHYVIAVTESERSLSFQGVNGNLALLL